MDAHSIQREACVLPRSTTAPALARGFVNSTLSSWSVGDTFADVPLLASELVTNAVRHANGDVALSLRLDRDRVRVAVHDDSDALPVLGDLDASSPAHSALASPSPACTKVLAITGLDRVFNLV